MANLPTRAGVTGSHIQAVSFGSQAYGSTAASWFGPAQPIAPMAPPDVTGRSWDYPSGFNLQVRPRAYEPVTFATLRELADGYDLLRLAIETRKDQLARMSWSVRNRDSGKRDAKDDRVEALTSFFRRPDGVNGWQDWLRPILEDLFVIDAPALYAQRTRGGQLVALVQLDGATIKPVIDAWGRTPQGPYADGSWPPAYQQIIKGVPASDYSVRDLLYRPRNKRVNHAYGFAPVEQVMTTVNIALRRQLYTLNYFQEGNIPDSIIQVPKEWTPDQIVTFQKAWDTNFTGDLAARRRAKFVPGGVGAGGVHETKTPDLKGEFDEWLAKLVCYAFSLSPQALTRQMNRASADTQKEISEEEGLAPLLTWLKAWFDDIIEAEFGAPDLEFSWDLDDEVDKRLQFETLTGYSSKGAITLNEMRQELGRDPYEDPLADQPMVLTGSGYVPLGAYQQQQEQAAESARLMAEARARRPADDAAGTDDPGQEERDRQRDFAKYSPDQPRDAQGRWVSTNGQAAAPHMTPLTTREKAGIVGAGLAALAVGALLHRRKPYRSYMSSYLAQHPERQAIHALHDASVHTPIADRERAAVVRYTGESYANINRHLRLGRKPTEDIGHIDAALRKSSLAEDTVVYRGVNLDRSKRLLKTLPGETFVDRGFPSTSISEEVARDFASYKAGPASGQVKPGKEGYVLSINVDKGASALPLKTGFSGSSFLHEVLLPRGSAFKVLNVDHDTKTIFAQHLGVAMEKAAEAGERGKGDADDADRFLWSDGDLEFYPVPDGDTTGADYAGYRPPQPNPIGKAFDPSQPRDEDGKWTGDGASATSWNAAEHEAMLIVKGTAIVAGAALAVLFAPEIAGVAGAIAGGEAVAAGTAAAIPWIATQANTIATGFFGSAAYQAGLSIAKANEYDTSQVEDYLRPLTEPIGVYSKAGSGGDIPTARFRKALAGIVDKAGEALLDAARGKATETSDPSHVEAVTNAVEAARDAFKRDVIGKLGKRLDKAWGGYRRPEPVPFDRPATRRAEAGITKRLTEAFAEVAVSVAGLLRADKLAKTEPEDRSRRISEEFDFGLLQETAEPIADDLENVASDAVHRASAQIGPDAPGRLVDQVNARAVAAARDRGAELVGMRWDEDGTLVPSRHLEMAITDTTRDELRTIIADGLAENIGTDAVAERISESFALSPERAALIAATEVARANGEAALASYKGAADLGITVRKAWLVTGGCCDVCEDNAAQGPIDLDEEFKSGDDTPPGHPNCRCSLTPVIGPP